jgi:hypothetical protein
MHCTKKKLFFNRKKIRTSRANSMNLNITVLAPLMLKRLAQTGVLIRFDYALSDPTLCTEVCRGGGGFETRVLFHCQPKIQLNGRSSCLYFC